MGVGRLQQVNLVVRDMAASLAFYRRLGLEVPEAVEGHVELDVGGGVTLELDAAETIERWDAGWGESTGGSAVLGFAVDSRAGVDELFHALVAEGHRAHQVPYDAFFGCRFAIDDPDGYPVALCSPQDPALRHWPPSPPPGS